MHMHQNPLRLAVIFTLLVSSLTLVSFGSNKPHYLFHVGDRRPVSTNVVWGYWADNESLRLHYKNTNDGIYAASQVHNGETIFESNVQDRRNLINTNIKYIADADGWNTQIEMSIDPEMTLKQATAKDTQEVTWFIAVSVENNDYKLVDHKAYTSFIYLSPQYVEENEVKVVEKSNVYPTENISVLHRKLNQQGKQIPHNQSKVNLFGLVANISETYALPSISEAFRRVVRLQKGLQQPIKGNDQKEKKLRDWEQHQVQKVKQANWTNQNYMVLFIYGTLKIGEKSIISLTNSTWEKDNYFPVQKFSQKSSEVLKLHSNFLTEQTLEKSNFVNHVLSNLLSGITFYYGRLYTQNSLTVHRQDYSYSFTPSRLIFPRSFLWDDGFHQSVMVHYQPKIVLDMLTAWMAKVDLFGWIGRQQIRGAQISSMMPDQRFIFQDWFEMNPPTLVLPILSLIQKAKEDKSLDGDLHLFFKNNFHKLEKWYRYFKSTQSHQSLQYPQLLNDTSRFYRWHCKDECSKGNFMGSGLDDYPRREKESEVAKEHVDLVSWLYLFSKSLAEMAKYLKSKESIQFLDQIKNINSNERQFLRNKSKFQFRVEHYENEAEKYIFKLYEKLLDPSDSLFKDIVVESQDVFIEKFVNKIGYINLFPFFTGMLSTDSQYSKNNVKRIEAILKCLQVMSDESLLLSEDGLRSLSKSDSLYGTQENYWRGAVWLPINYMVLRACKVYYWNDEQVSQQVQTFYSILRERLINSLYKNYEQTGYLFENYYEGKGHRGFPFYGWTATIVNIITQKY